MTNPTTPDQRAREIEIEAEAKKFVEDHHFSYNNGIDGFIAGYKAAMLEFAPPEKEVDEKECLTSFWILK